MTNFETYFFLHAYKFIGFSLGKPLSSDKKWLDLFSHKLKCNHCKNLNCIQCRLMFLADLRSNKKNQLYKNFEFLRHRQIQIWAAICQFNEKRISQNRQPIPIQDLLILLQTDFNQNSLSVFNNIAFTDIKLACVYTDKTNLIKHPVASGIGRTFLQKHFPLIQFLLLPHINAKKSLFTTLGIRTRPVKFSPPRRNRPPLLRQAQQSGNLSVTSQSTTVLTPSQAGKTKQSPKKNLTNTRRGLTEIQYQQLSNEFIKLSYLFNTTTKDVSFLKEVMAELTPKLLQKHCIQLNQGKTLLTNHYTQVVDILNIIANTLYEKKFTVPGSVAFREIYGGQGQIPSLYKKFFNALQYRLNIFYQAKKNIQVFPNLNAKTIPHSLPELYPNFSDMFYYSFIEFNVVDLNLRNNKVNFQQELFHFIDSQDLYFLKKKYSNFHPTKAIIPHIFSQVICPTHISLDSFLERLAIEFPSKHQYSYIKLNDFEDKLVEFIDDIISHCILCFPDLDEKKMNKSVRLSHPFIQNKYLTITPAFQRRLILKLNSGCSYYLKLATGGFYVDILNELEDSSISDFDRQKRADKVLHIKREIIYEALVLCYISYIQKNIRNNTSKSTISNNRHEVKFESIENDIQTFDIRENYATNLRIFGVLDNKRIALFKKIINDSLDNFLSFADKMKP